MNQISIPSLSDGQYAPLASFDIEAQILLCPYDHRRLEETYKHLDKQILDFDPVSIDADSLPFGGRVVQSYGAYLYDHLDWTSKTLGEFLYFQGYAEGVVDRVVQAFKRHDIGKTLQPGLWKITEEKQQLSPEQKQERVLHTVLGAQSIQAAFDSGLNDPTPEDMVGVAIGTYLALNHHERLNGSGPHGRSHADICPILRAATIVDSFHGKLKAGKSAEHIFTELNGPKHKGEFDLDLLKKFRAFYQRLDHTAKPGALPQPS